MTDFLGGGCGHPQKYFAPPRKLNAHWIKWLPCDWNKDFELNETKNKDFETNMKFQNFLKLFPFTPTLPPQATVLPDRCYKLAQRRYEPLRSPPQLNVRHSPKRRKGKKLMYNYQIILKLPLNAPLFFLIVEQL